MLFTIPRAVMIVTERGREERVRQSDREREGEVFVVPLRLVEAAMLISKPLITPPERHAEEQQFNVEPEQENGTL